MCTHTHIIILFYFPFIAFVPCSSSTPHSPSFCFHIAFRNSSFFFRLDQSFPDNFILNLTPLHPLHKGSCSIHTPAGVPWWRLISSTEVKLPVCTVSTTEDKPQTWSIHWARLRDSTVSGFLLLWQNTMANASGGGKGLYGFFIQRSLVWLFHTTGAQARQEPGCLFTHMTLPTPSRV